MYRIKYRIPALILIWKVYLNKICSSPRGTVAVTNHCIRILVTHILIVKISNYQHSLYRSIYMPLNIVYIANIYMPLNTVYIAQYTCHSLQFSSLNIHATQYSLYRSIYMPLNTVYIALYTCHSTQFISLNIHAAQYSLYRSIYMPLNTVYIAQYTYHYTNIPLSPLQKHCDQSESRIYGTDLFIYDTHCLFRRVLFMTFIAYLNVSILWLLLFI